MPTHWVIGQQEHTHPSRTCYMCGQRGHLSWMCILHQCVICHRYALGHDQMRCPVHLTWEASDFPVLEKVEGYHLWEIPLSEVTYHIWNLASNYNGLGTPGITVSMREQDAGHMAAMVYRCIYWSTIINQCERSEEDWPKDLPILERE